jgi:hypothetical protein
MAVRARLFDDGNRFDERIGPKSGGTYAMGSETDFTTRMEQKGESCRFVSKAIVEHMIRGFQMERAWIMARATRYGRGAYHRERLRGVAAPATFFGLPKQRMRVMAGRLVRLLVAMVLRDAERAFRESWGLHCDWGYIAEARGRQS